MTKPGQVASLADFAHDELGSIDLWCVLSLPLPNYPSVQCDLSQMRTLPATTHLSLCPV